MPTPKTWVFWNARTAAEFCASATYPLVAKLSSGIQSNNVRLVLFEGVHDMVYNPGLLWMQEQERKR